MSSQDHTLSAARTVARPYDPADDVAAVASVPALPTVLEVIARTNGMGFVAVARVTDDRWILCGVHDTIAFGLRPGGELPIETTICRDVRHTRTPTIISDVAEDERFRTHPTPARYGFRSYVSVPIVLPDGSFFGTLCAIDPEPRALDSAEVLATFTPFAQLLSLHIDAHRRLAGNASAAARHVALEQRFVERTAERDLLATIVQTADVMVMVCDTEGRIMAVNPAMVREMQRAFGVRPMVGDVLLDLFSDRPEIREPLHRHWALGLAGDEGTHAAAFDDGPEGPIHYEYRFRRLFDDGGRLIGCYQFVTDISDRVREQAKLAEAEAALRQSQKMEAVGQLTGGLAHDFNNLVTGITGSLELLRTRIEQGRLGEIGRYVTAAQDAAQRAAALTHRLLAFSRRQSLDPKPTDVAAMVAGLQELVSRTMGPEIAIETAHDEGQWPVLADPSQLESAILNLCINARDAMRGGGKLRISTANRVLAGREAAELELAPGEYVVLCVEDDGSGMPPGVAARAFDPFFTTKPIGEGTGLGLSMVYGFARQSGGQVRIRSILGQGTAVSIYLPRHRGDAPPPEAEPPRAPAARAGVGETVLIVDDEATIRMLVRDVLDDHGYAAVEAADGAAGLQVLQSDRRVDLLVTDIGLPGGINGRQLAASARSTRPTLKVLFITGYAQDSVLNQGWLEEGMHVLPKPFAMEALTGKIRELIEAR